MLPVAGAEITPELIIGSVTIRPFPSSIYNSFIKYADQQEMTDTQRQQVIYAYEESRKKVEGHAAAFVTVTAELNLARDIAFQRVEDALAILRLFTVANRYAERVSYLRPLGHEYTRQQHIYELSDIGATYEHGSIDKGPAYVNFNEAQLANLLQTPFSQAKELLAKSDRSPFQDRFLEFLIRYSRHTLEPELDDKLIRAFGALDAFCLSNNRQSIMQTVGDCIAISVGESVEERFKILSSVRKAYELRSRTIHHGTKTNNYEIVNELLMYVMRFIFGLLSYHDRFLSEQDFFSYIERTKYSASSSMQSLKKQI